MITLCGFPISNYYNKVKLALLEKGVPFEEERVMTYSDQEILRQKDFARLDAEEMAAVRRMMLKTQ